VRRFDGKVVLLTGSGGGQGRVAALRFAREGATVVGCDVNAASQDETRRLLASEGLTLHGSAPVDLGDAEQARQWVDGAAEQHGRIDVLYNNASAARFGPIGELSVEDWRYTIRNELDLVFYTTKVAWRHLAVRGGVVLNISSVAAWAGSKVAGISAHAAAKGAVISFTRQLAIEGAQLGIRAVSISPGLIATPGTEAFMRNPVSRAAILDGVPMDRPGESDEVVSTALFLASAEASFITGSDIVVDGGLLAH
jgi:meso-butanediol dehydrogenase / (S,S)-butanediol dehydrogenase / diacetyl reductase